MEQNKIGILFSGGLESTSLLQHYTKLNYKIFPIYIKYGYIWEITELIYAKKISKYYNLELNILDFTEILKVTQLGKIENIHDNIIPLRNLSFFTFASMYFNNINIYKIAIGIQGNLDYPDTNMNYIKNCQKLIREGLKKEFIIEVPFYGMNKNDILNKYNIPFHMIFSCTNPINKKRCHKCYKCQILDKLIKNRTKLP